MKLASEVDLHNDIIHDRVVQDIAAHRFGLDGWNVLAKPEKLPEGAQLGAVPDILATENGDVVAVGHVAAGDICEEQARKWKALGDSCVRFYLYVPDEQVEAAQQMIRKHEVMCAGLRSYRYNGKLEIEPVCLDMVDDREDSHPWWAKLGSDDTVN